MQLARPLDPLFSILSFAGVRLTQLIRCPKPHLLRQILLAFMLALVLLVVPRTVIRRGLADALRQFACQQFQYFRLALHAQDRRRGFKQ